MAKKSLSVSMPWYRATFDLEGLGFGALALVLAIILGSVFWPLGLIFYLAFAVIILASRDCERTSPEGAGLVLSPCDGVIESVSEVSPPRELRWDQPEVVRIRIASSPFSINGMRAPITGNVESFLIEPGAPTALSMDSDNTDLKEAFILTSDEEKSVGLRIATGGLGPRLDIDLEAGDGVRAGRKIGVRRLGGWCDVYLPPGSSVSLLAGMTVIAGETKLCDGAVSAAETGPETDEYGLPVKPETATPAEEPVVEEVSEPVPEETSEEAAEPDIAPDVPDEEEKKD